MAESAAQKAHLHTVPKALLQTRTQGKEVVLEEGAEIAKAAGIPQTRPRQEGKIITLYSSDKNISTFFPLLNGRKGWLEPFQWHAPLGAN